jgi:hypothetical protein
VASAWPAESPVPALRASVARPVGLAAALPAPRAPVEAAESPVAGVRVTVGRLVWLAGAVSLAPEAPV